MNLSDLFADLRAAISAGWREWKRLRWLRSLWINPEDLSTRFARSTREQRDISKTAARLFPDSQSLQAEWMRAVGVVRSTRRGWLLDRPQEKRHA